MKVAQFLLGSIPLLIQFYADFYRKIDFENTMLKLESELNVPKIKTYDFIIVGGGSAGCVLAGRLSEFFNVLLLEAGGTPPPATAVPLYSSAVEQSPSINYFHKSVPQTNASLSNNGIMNSSTGRMLGGCGSHNTMVHNRGSPKDYDNWATLLNDNSFKYTNVLKYFKRMETFNGPKFGNVGEEYFGEHGPIQIHTEIGPILDIWFDAATELGYRSQDASAYQREGFATANMAISKGQRSSSYVEYIKPYENLRKSLTVIRYANVSEVLLDDNKKAYGVAYTRHGIPQIAHAHKEIILSAGTYSSPLLLMKSGIGPEDILNAAEIPVKVPSEAVGKNLADHTGMPLPKCSVNDTSIFAQMNTTDVGIISEEYHNGEGVLTLVSSLGVIGVQGFFVSSRATSPDWPDNKIFLLTSAGIDGGEGSVIFSNIVGRPQSKGALTLDTEKYKAGVRDDSQLALTDFKLLTHPDDVEVLLEGIKLIYRILETDAFKRFNLTCNAIPDPACSSFTFLSDDYWKCEAQQLSAATSHPVGTCSMGPDSTNSTTSVVDTKFRVKGVSNLRIVDASVIPKIPNANINAPVMMLAEKAAEDIINFYHVRPTSTNRFNTTPHPTSTNRFNTTPSSSTSIRDYYKEQRWGKVHQTP